MTIEESIKLRRSVRTYSGSIAQGVLDKVKNICATACQPLQGCMARVVVIKSELDGGIGTYGVIRKAPAWLALLRKGERVIDRVNAGMLGEELVLKLTQIGLGTCWLGGTFSGKDVDKAIDYGSDEHLEAVIPFGYAAPKEHLASRIMAKMVGSSNRLPFDSLFEISAKSSAKDALEMVRLAPSSRNCQPWRAIENSQGIHFYCAKDSNFAPLDMGIGMIHYALCRPDGRWKDLAADVPTHDGWSYILTRVE